MENLPVEVLEIVFCQMSKMEDIQMCLNTNSKWRKIIENMWAKKLLSVKILVVGSSESPLEIIDLSNPNIKPVTIQVDESVSIFGSTGGILQNQPLICGGSNMFDEITSEISIIGMPNHCFEMIMPWFNASSIVLNESKLWVTGGWNHEDGMTNSTEIISLDQPPVPGPDLPFTVYDHSMVLVDPTTIYLIGGCQNGRESDANKTWIIDPTNDFQVKEGPSLNISRVNPSCSKMKIHGKIFLVVAGGSNYHGNAGDTVELLDTTCPEQGWKMGMKYYFS